MTVVSLVLLDSTPTVLTASDQLADVWDPYLDSYSDIYGSSAGLLSLSDATVTAVTLSDNV